MIFRQLFDQVSSTYTYLLADEASREAVLIDCVFERHGRHLALIASWICAWATFWVPTATPTT